MSYWTKVASLLETELFPPEDMEGLAVETKLAWGNKEAPHWLSYPQREHVWIPCQQSLWCNRYGSNERLWFKKRNI